MKYLMVQVNSKVVMPLKSLVGVPIRQHKMIIGLSKIHGVLIGVSMVMLIFLLDKNNYILMTSQLLLLQRLSKKLMKMLIVQI